MSKVETLTVMYDKGENVNGVNIRPYQTFKAEITPEIQEKIKKGFLVKGTVTEDTLKGVKKLKRRK